jgi:hypothetical protein
LEGCTRQEKENMNRDKIRRRRMKKDRDEEKKRMKAEQKRRHKSRKRLSCFIDILHLRQHESLANCVPIYTAWFQQPPVALDNAARVPSSNKRSVQ